MIAITGPNGFIARNLKNEFSYTVGMYREDLVDVDTIRRFIHDNDITVIYHLATIYDIPTSNNLNDMIESNYAVGVRLVYACMEQRIRLVYTTSYFADDPITFYGMQKKQVADMMRMYKGNSAIVKIYNTYGNDDDRNLFLSKMYRGEINLGDMIDKTASIKYNHVRAVTKFLMQVGNQNEFIDCEVPYEEKSAEDLMRYLEQERIRYIVN